MQITQWRWIYIPLVIVMLIAMQSCQKEEVEFPEGAIAAVNGEVITQEDLDRELSMVRQQFAGMDQATAEQLAKIKDDLMESLISSKVLYQESQKKKIEIDSAMIDERFVKVKKQFSKGGDFEEMLLEMGLTEDTLKVQLRRGMAIQKLIEQDVISKFEISEKDAKDYYDEHMDHFKQPEKIRASHILIKVEPGSDESVKAEALKKIKKIQKELGKGGKFEELAKKYSDCPSGAKGGDLGYFGKGQMVKPFEDAVFSLKPGEISDIIETDFGYHLIEAGDKKAEALTEYKDVKGKLTQYLKQLKTKEEMPKYIEGLKEKAKIERFLPEAEKQEQDD
ncbi:MAG: peptidylprolyl isomerase [Thermodesulfobacteriota bacterium]|nr:peptidylprolyl isomerase [Thermodesulfobacteriota bacterium]